MRSVWHCRDHPHVFLSVPPLHGILPVIIQPIPFISKIVQVIIQEISETPWHYSVGKERGSRGDVPGSQRNRDSVSSPQGVAVGQVVSASDLTVNRYRALSEFQPSRHLHTFSSWPILRPANSLSIRTIYVNVYPVKTFPLFGKTQ